MGGVSGSGWSAVGCAMLEGACGAAEGASESWGLCVTVTVVGSEEPAEQAVSAAAVRITGSNRVRDMGPTIAKRPNTGGAGAFTVGLVYLAFSTISTRR